MAKYQWTGAGETAGDAPALFTNIWEGTLSEWQVKTDAEAQTEGKVLAFIGSGSLRRGLALTAAGMNNSGRVDVRGRFYAVAGASLHFAKVNMSGAPGAANNIYVGSVQGGDWGIAYYDNNVFSLGSVGPINFATGWYQFRFERRTDGTNKLTIWPDSGDEATGGTTTTAAKTMVPGGLGVGTFGATPGKIDWISFGTGTDDADDLSQGYTPPASVLSNPEASMETSGAYAGSVDTSEASGTVSYVITSTPDAPTPPQVIAGEDSSGAIAVGSGSVNVTTVGAKEVSGSGLSLDTTYYMHFVQEYGAETSEVASTLGFSSATPLTATPVSLAATDITAKSATLSWQQG